MSEKIFDLNPLLTGDLLRLRPIQDSDFVELYQVACDPLIWDQHPFPRFELSAFKEFFDATKNSGGLMVYDLHTNRLIGSSSYYSLQEDQVSIGYTFLVRSHWGGKFNRELKKLMVGHALKYVSKVYFDIGEFNLRSRRAMEKIGGKFVKKQLNRGVPYTLYLIDQQSYDEDLGKR